MKIVSLAPRSCKMRILKYKKTGPRRHKGQKRHAQNSSA
jgi:hypothetical protein